MMRAVAVAAVLGLAAQAEAEPEYSGIIGGWHGVGLQVGPSGPQSTWDIVMRIRADITSRIEYPSLACKGTLHELRRLENEIEFREEITEGDCITGGKLVVRLTDNRVWWYWHDPKGAADASAVLYRDVDAIG